MYPFLDHNPRSAKSQIPDPRSSLAELIAHPAAAQTTKFSLRPAQIRAR